MYMPCWIEFALTHSILAKQTPTALYVTIVAFLENILPLTSDPINQIISMPPKTRVHTYLTLSRAEINKLSSATIKCNGMQFIDNEDPNDTATGTFTEIMRYKKTRKLVF